MHSDQLKYLIELSKSPSLNAASEKINISCTGLSHSINALEKELGVKLIIRTNKGSQLTKEGQLLVNLSSKFLDGVYNLSSQTSSTLTGDIHFITTTNLLEISLLDFIIEMKDMHPQLNISYEIINNYQDILAKLGKDSSVFALFFHTEINDLISHARKNKIILEEFFRSNIVCLLSAEHTLAKYNSLTLKQLNKHLCFVRFPDIIDTSIIALQKTITIEENPILFDKYVQAGKGYSLGGTLPFSPYYFPHIENILIKTVIDAPQVILFLGYNKTFRFDDVSKLFLDSYRKKIGIQ